MFILLIVHFQPLSRLKNSLFIFILNVVIESFKSANKIVLFSVLSLFDAMFFPILKLLVSVVMNFGFLLLKFWLKFSASQSLPWSLSLYILWRSRACLYWQICSGVALFAIVSKVFLTWNYGTPKILCQIKVLQLNN